MAVLSQIADSGLVSRYRYDPQGYRVGPLATLTMQVTLVLVLVWGLGSLADLHIPPTMGIVVSAPAFLALILVPRSVIMQFPVSLSLTALFALALISVFWSADPVNTNLTIRSLLIPALVTAIICGLLSLDEITTAVLWAMRVIILITLVALAVSPAARTHISTDIYLPDYPGWHGFFSHKNELAPVLVFTIPTALVWDLNWTSRWLTVGLCWVLLIGSNSATGLSAAMFAMTVWFWLKIYQSQKDERNRTLLFVASASAAMAVAVGIAASLATITSAYGKDATFSGRTAIWEASLTAISSRPFLGYGFAGLFGFEKLTRETLDIWNAVGFPAHHAHNGVLDLVLQLGIIGLVLFGLLWASIFREAWLKIYAMPEIVLWIMTCLLANLLMSFSEKTFFGPWFIMFAMFKTILMRRRDMFELPTRRLLSERLAK